MEGLVAHVVNHPLLAGAAVALAVAVLVYEWRARARSHAAVGPADAVRLMNEGAVLVDVRTPADYRNGHIAGARNVPGAEIAAGAPALDKFRDKTVITCCESGATSGAAARELTRQGFKTVLNLRGGLAAWRADNLPLVKD